MKIIVTISRIIVGLLFIFSGLVKAIDPLGLTYKMQEFFEAWGNSGFMPSLMHSLNDYALWFSLIMITLEVLLGVALLLGIMKKMTLWLLLLLVLFFTFLTSYVLFSGKIKACGCFGDCIPLTPVQTFTKDLILMVLVLLLLFGQKFISNIFSKKSSWLLLAIATSAVIYLQWHVLTYLPLKDCLPYKTGNNISELRKMPKDAVPDKYDYIFVYEKDGVKKEFTAAALPDSTWKYVDRKQTLIQKGKNNVPPISDFSLIRKDSSSANDVTEDVLNQKGNYYLFFVKDFENKDCWLSDFYTFYASLSDKSKIYIVTSDYNQANTLFNSGTNPIGLQILVCDATAIKTAARVNPTIYKMNGPVVENKWSWADFDEVMQK